MAYAVRVGNPRDSINVIYPGRVAHADGSRKRCQDTQQPRFGGAGLEVGLQNGGLAAGLASQMGKIATVGLAPAIFSSLMNITGSILAGWWGNNKKETPEEEVIDK